LELENIRNETVAMNEKVNKMNTQKQMIANSNEELKSSIQHLELKLKQSKTKEE